MENNLIQIFISITILFFILLAIKEFINRKFKLKLCAICGAVSLTWVIFLFLYWYGIFQNKIILALLIGESTLGIFYIIKRKAIKNLKIFMLPFLLTLIFLAYLLLEIPKDIFLVGVFLIVLWGLFILIYLHQSNKNANKLINKLIKCCRE